MTNRAMQFVAVGAILFAAANLMAQGPQKRGDRPAPGAAASPVPASAAPNASSSTAVLNAPQHSPDQLDFGSVSVGASSLKTFTLTTNAAGNVSVTIPPGPFRIAEFRELGPLQGSSKNSANPLNAGGLSQVKSRITYREGQNGPFQWSMAPNEQIQLDIVFAPKSQTISGVSSAVMNVNGPGPHGNWVLTIPLRGTFNGMKATSPDPSQQPSATHTGNALPLSGKGGGSSPGLAAPSTARRLTPAEALSRMQSAGKPVLVATARNSKLSKNGIATNIFTQLKQQKQTADLERGRIMAANPRGGVQTTKSMGSAGAGNVAAATPTAASGVGGGNSLSQAQAPVGNALACAKSAPDALIFSINGQKNNAAVLSTDPDSNLFTFNGCNFSDTQGSIHLYGGFAHGNIPFEISFWNDHSIVARLQPDLAGELDRDNVNLVLVSGNGHQTQFQGFKFYAARQTYVLSSIPNLESKIIYGPPDPAHCEHADNYTFMSCGAFADPNDGLPVYVSRWGVKGDKGTDQFTISGLKPGFEISDIGLWISPEISDKQGWSLYSFAENISVSYAFDWKKPVADYGLRISVSGPRGIDSPWK